VLVLFLVASSLWLAIAIGCWFFAPIAVVVVAVASHLAALATGARRDL
jgi:hypothetical protein